MQSNTEIVKMWNDKKNIEDRCAIKQKRPIETIIEKKINDARKLTHTLTTCNNHNDDVQQRRDASPHANLARNHRQRKKQNTESHVYQKNVKSAQILTH